MKERSTYLKEVNVAGRQYHEADLVWDQLKIGTKLQLVYDSELVAIDPNAVAIVFTNAEGETFCIGYVPRTENSDIAAFLKMGWTDCFECRISRINPEAHYERQLYVTIRIVRR